MKIDKSRWIKKHGQEPNGEVRNWCFTLSRGVSHLHQYTDLLEYAEAEKRILRQARSLGIESIRLEVK